MKVLFVFILLLVQSIFLYSQDSLLFYLEIAAKNNPTVMQKYHEYEASLQKVPQVGSLPDPDISIGVFLSPMELINGNQLADIRLMQMFPWFGVLKNAKDEMSLMAKAKYELFRDAKLQTFYDVQRTCYELYKVKQDIRISENNIEILHTLERLALVKFKSSSSVGSIASGSNMNNNSPQNNTSGSSSMGGGMINANNNQSSIVNPPSSMGSSASGGSGLTDIYRIQMDIGELDNNIALLKNQQSTISVRFNTYLNRPVKTAISLPDTLKPFRLNVPLLAVSDSMLNNNPMLGMLHYEQQSYDARKKMVSRMGYPMIGIGLNYSLINKNPMSTSAMNGSDMIMPMVTVTLPIYRKKYKAMQTEVDLMKMSTEQGYTGASNSLQTEYYEAIQLYQDAERRMKLYENQSLLAKKSLEIMIKSFSTSSSGLTDILQIRQQKLNYEFKEVEAVVDFNTAIAWLERLMANNN